MSDGIGLLGTETGPVCPSSRAYFDLISRVSRTLFLIWCPIVSCRYVCVCVCNAPSHVLSNVFCWSRCPSHTTFPFNKNNHTRNITLIANIIIIECHKYHVVPSHAHLRIHTNSSNTLTLTRTHIFISVFNVGNSPPLWPLFVPHFVAHIPYTHTPHFYMFLFACV